jgi:hypothetical protein
VFQYLHTILERPVLTEVKGRFEQCIYFSSVKLHVTSVVATEGGSLSTAELIRVEIMHNANDGVHENNIRTWTSRISPLSLQPHNKSELTVHLFHTTARTSQLIYISHRNCSSNICGFVVITSPWKSIANYPELVTAGPETCNSNRGNFSWNYGVRSYRHFVQAADSPR